MMTRAIAAITSAIAAACLTGCGAPRDREPPKIVLGQQECEECRMIISEEQFAAAVVFESDEGTTKYAFDDVGCLIDWLHKHGGNTTQVAYVHDYNTTAWLNAASAFFVHSESLRTPMASQVTACGDEAAARALQERIGGERRSWTELINH